MSALDDGREVLCTLALPLPLSLAGELGKAITQAAERSGYTDVTVMADGTNRVVAQKRTRPVNRAHEPFCDGTCQQPTGGNCPAGRT